jgi:hypothetical protein
MAVVATVRHGSKIISHDLCSNMKKIAHNYTNIYVIKKLVLIGYGIFYF